MTSGGAEAWIPVGNSAVRPLELAQCALFQDLSADQIAELTRQCRCVRFAAGDIILAAEEDRPHNVFVLLQGTAEVLRKGPFGNFVPLATLHPGMYFGEFAAIDGRSGSATVKANSNAILAEIPCEVFRLLLRDEPTVAWRMMERMVHVIRALDARVAGLHGCQEEFDRIHRELFLVNL